MHVHRGRTSRMAQVSKSVMPRSVRTAGMERTDAAGRLGFPVARVRFETEQNRGTALHDGVQTRQSPPHRAFLYSLPREIT